mmetsp:Transcript_45811/g.132659  ORF Transcript_45811/g.132659 Transcript_45811/m.132659 type:complete len:238 (+) Transcript_45811:82-795(+)
MTAMQSCRPRRAEQRREQPAAQRSAVWRPSVLEAALPETELFQNVPGPEAQRRPLSAPPALAAAGLERLPQRSEHVIVLERLLLEPPALVRQRLVRRDRRGDPALVPVVGHVVGLQGEPQEPRGAVDVGQEELGDLPPVLGPSAQEVLPSLGVLLLCELEVIHVGKRPERDRERCAVVARILVGHDFGSPCVSSADAGAEHGRGHLPVHVRLGLRHEPVQALAALFLVEVRALGEVT